MGWHWRLGHCDRRLPNLATRQKKMGGVFVKCDLNEDCAVCDKSKYRRLPFYKPDIKDYTRLEAWVKAHVDEFGGLKSFKCKSINGAVGGFVFCDDGSGGVIPKLYAKKSQFEFQLRVFFVELALNDRHCSLMIVDGSSSLINDRTQALAASFDCRMEVSSPGTPYENRYAERAVRKVLEISRAMMIGAPHLPQSMWGTAVLNTRWIIQVLPQSGKKYDYQSPYFIQYGRAPEMKRIPIKVFGAAVQWSELGEGEKPKHKTDERTKDGAWVGLSKPSTLILEADGKRIRKIASARVRAHEGIYCKEPLKSVGHLREMLRQSVDIAPTDTIAGAIQTIHELRSCKESLHEEYRREMLSTDDSGGESVDTSTEWLPDFANVQKMQDEISRLSKAVQLLQGKKKPAVSQEVAALLKDKHNMKGSQPQHVKPLLDHKGGSSNLNPGTGDDGKSPVQKQVVNKIITQISLEKHQKVQKPKH